MEGNLYRWTNAIFGWQKKYVEIEGDEFRYYKNKGGKLQGVISLRNSKIEMIANEPLRLIVQLAEGTIMYLKCNSISDKVKWVNALSMAQQKIEVDPRQKAELPCSAAGVSQEFKKELVGLLRSRILNDSAKLNAFVTQVWTLQGLLEGSLSDFSEDLEKLPSPPPRLKENADSIRTYTSELKHSVHEAIQEIETAKLDLMNVIKGFLGNVSPTKSTEDAKELKTPEVSRTTPLYKKPVQTQSVLAETEINEKAARRPGPNNAAPGLSDSSEEPEIDLEKDVFYDAIEEDGAGSRHPSDIRRKRSDDEFPVPPCESPIPSMSETFALEEFKRPPGQLTCAAEPDPEPELRTTLPAKRNPKNKPSFWTVLKDLIGKDLAHFGVPVYFNEPISMLQKVAEVMENEYLLAVANEESDSLRRLAYVSVFNAVQYNSVVGRSLKPFNPILGETFEYVTSKYRFFSEQVSHHPPISACHAESQDYELFFHTNVTTRFWMKSLEFRPLGKAHFVLKAHDEHYIVDRPSTSAQNIIFGTLYLDCSGEATSVNTKTNEKCVLNYHGKGWSDDTYGLIDGYVYNVQGDKAIEIKGKWSESIWMTDLRTGHRETIWKRAPPPDDWENLYCFTSFTLQLNYLPERLKRVLPPTDTRFRPDQRALEEGNVDLASDEKYRLEELQRAARRDREQRGIEYKPVYFVEHVDPITEERTYISNGNYWRDRATHSWDHLPKIYQEQ